MGRALSLYLLRTSADGTAASPYRYRVLTPLVMFFVSDSIILYAVVELSIIVLFLLTISALARVYNGQPALWVAIAALMNVLAGIGGMTYSTSRYLEAILVCISLILIRTQPHFSWRTVGIYTVMVTLASLNRTTGYMLVAIWFGFLWWMSGRRSGYLRRWAIRTSVIHMLVWAVVTGGLVLVLGNAPNWETIQSVADWNRREWLSILLLNAPILWLVFVALMTEWRRLLVVSLLVYLPPVLLLGRWTEVGLWLPMLPLLLLALEPVASKHHATSADYTRQ